jgi:hypothetical protein
MTRRLTVKYGGQTIKNDTVSIRRILATVSLIVALVMEPICLAWSTFVESLGSDNGFLGDKNYILVTSIAVLAGLVVFVSGRSRFRWLLLVLFLPLTWCLYHDIKSELHFMKMRSLQQPPLLKQTGK